MYAQMDDEDNQFQLLAQIQYHRKNGTSISIEEVKIRSANGKERYNIMTRGWEVMVLWKYGSTDWIHLKYINDSNPVEVAEYAVANCIQDEPTFAWWVYKLLRRRNWIVSNVRSNYCRMTQKFGILLPKTVKGSLSIYKGNGNDYW